MSTPHKFPTNDGSRIECQIVLTNNEGIGTRVIINRKMLENIMEMIDTMNTDAPVYERHIALYMPVQSDILPDLYKAMEAVIVKHNKESKDLDL